MLGLQPLAHREGAAGIGRPLFLDAEPAVLRSRRLPARGRGLRPPQARRRLHGHDRAQQSRGQRQPLHEGLSRDRGARPGAVVPLRPELGRADLQELQPLPHRACARLHLVQHRQPVELGHQRHGRALPEAAGGVDRVRPRLGPVPDAEARPRVHAAPVGGAAAEEEAVGLHARHVLLVAADGDPGHGRAGVHVPHDQCGDAAPVLLRLSALGLRPAVDDHGSAVPVREGQAQHPRRHRGAAVQAAAAQREAEREPEEVRQSTPPRPDPLRSRVLRRAALVPPVLLLGRRSGHALRPCNAAPTAS